MSNKTLTGFMMNTKAVKRGKIYEAIDLPARQPRSQTDLEAAKHAVKVLKEIVTSRESEKAK
jgi:hypothetical protein